jgi:hypothetical protein
MVNNFRQDKQDFQDLSFLKKILFYPVNPVKKPLCEAKKNQCNQ